MSIQTGNECIDTHKLGIFKGFRQSIKGFRPSESGFQPIYGRNSSDIDGYRLDEPGLVSSGVGYDRHGSGVGRDGALVMMTRDDGSDRGGVNSSSHILTRVAYIDHRKPFIC